MKLPAACCGVSKRNYGVANPASQARRRRASFIVVHLAIHPCNKLQDILAKTNERNLQRAYGDCNGEALCVFYREYLNSIT
jgi:hypothetical protein